MKINDTHFYTANNDNFSSYFKKLWQYKILIWVFAKRDLQVKYAQTWLGVSWSIIQPLTAMTVFSVFFGYILKWQTANIPFPLYVLSGLLGWNFFSYIVNAGTGSVQESSNIIKKIYFPKSILPLSKVIVALTEFAISLLILIPLLIYFNMSVSWKVIFIPFALLFNAICALTLVFWIAAFAYRKRDLIHLLPFIVYFGIWITPVFFSPTILPQKIQHLVNLNPMTHVIDIWRWLIFNETGFNYYWLLSFAAVSAMCITGMYFYNQNENKFSEYV